MQHKPKDFAICKVKCTTERKPKLPIIQLSDCSRKQGRISHKQNKAVDKHLKVFKGNYNGAQVNIAKQNYRRPIAYVETEVQTSPIRKPERVPQRIITKKKNMYYLTRQQKRMNMYLVEWDDRTRTWETVSSINNCYPMIAEFEISRNLSREMKKFSDFNKQSSSHRKINIDDSIGFDNDSPIDRNEDRLQTQQSIRSQHKSRHRNKKNHFETDNGVINMCQKRSAMQFTNNIQKSINNEIDNEEHESDGCMKNKTKKHSHNVRQNENSITNEVQCESEHRIECQHQNEAGQTEQLVGMSSQNAKSSKHSGQPSKLIHCIELQEDDSFAGEIQHNLAESDNQNAEPQCHRVENQVLSQESNHCTFIMNFEDLNMPLFPQLENESELPNAVVNFGSNVNEIGNKQQKDKVVVIVDDEQNDSLQMIEGVDQQNCVQKYSDSNLTENNNSYSKTKLSSRIDKVMRKFSWQNMIKPKILQTTQTCTP